MAFDWKEWTPLFQITLPLAAIVWAGITVMNKRIDDLGIQMREMDARHVKLFADLAARLDKIDAKLENHSERLTLLETRKWGD